MHEARLVVYYKPTFVHFISNLNLTAPNLTSPNLTSPTLTSPTRIMKGMRYLADHPLGADITARMAALVPAVPGTVHFPSPFSRLLFSFSSAGKTPFRCVDICNGSARGLGDKFHHSGSLLSLTHTGMLSTLYSSTLYSSTPNQYALHAGFGGHSQNWL